MFLMTNTCITERYFSNFTFHLASCTLHNAPFLHRAWQFLYWRATYTNFLICDSQSHAYTVQLFIFGALPVSQAVPVYPTSQEHLLYWLQCCSHQQKNVSSDKIDLSSQVIIHCVPTSWCSNILRIVWHCVPNDKSIYALQRDASQTSHSI